MFLFAFILALTSTFVCRIKQQLARDQKAATQPDCTNPFKNYRDACNRLLRFHVFQDADPNYAEMLHGKFYLTVFHNLHRPNSLW